MRTILAICAGVLCLAAISGGDAIARTKSERCADYAHQAMQNTPTSTGVVRGAARGAIIGGIAGNAGTGAAIGAATGGTRRVIQKNRSYQYYYDSCMRH
ncbi:MAG TPA: glycine zipper family protein [Rhizomicrobium sp.]|nr:glycine zipper family protein [Rhizomicrobium sp.]